MNKSLIALLFIALQGLWPSLCRAGAGLGAPAPALPVATQSSTWHYCVDPDWPPFEQVDAQGQHVGIAADLLHAVAKASGVTLTLLPTANWDESLEASKNGRCQVLSFLNRTPKRDEWLNFTEPLLTDENVFITREEHPFITDLAALSGQTVVLPKGTSVEERLRREFPGLKFMLVDSEAQAFAAVNARRADLTLRSLIVAASTIKRGGWFNLKIAGQLPGYGNQLRMGVVKSQPGLRDQLNLGVAALTPAQRSAIVDKHIQLVVTTGIDPRPLWALGGVLLTVLLTSAYWIRRLRRVNAELKRVSVTDALTSLQNRTGFEPLYQKELSRSRRHGQALSVVLADIDWFKRINDEWGHPVGDRVLLQMGALLRDSARACDTVFRWGGEEFLILCPETSAGQVLQLAERLRAITQAHDFGLGRPVTLSLGVSTLNAQDEAGHQFEQVDAALYQAKAQGRNRVVVAGVAQG